MSMPISTTLGQGIAMRLYPTPPQGTPTYSYYINYYIHFFSYRQIPAGASKPEILGTESGTGPVELVTVPALGSEWKSSELRAMTKSGKREARYEKFATKWRAFRRDEHGFCGISWLTRRLFVWIIFVLCVVVGITLAFTIPRVPAFAVNSNTPLNGSSNVGFSRTPANFSFNTNLNLQVDTTSNFIPLHFNSIQATVFDSDTNKQVGAGNLGSRTLSAKKFTPVIFPISFNYTAINDTDQTCMSSGAHFLVFEREFMSF